MIKEYDNFTRELDGQIKRKYTALKEKYPGHEVIAVVIKEAARFSQSRILTLARRFSRHYETILSCPL